MSQAAGETGSLASAREPQSDEGLSRSAPLPAAEAPRWREVLRAMRPKQWVKNLLLMLPLLLAHQLATPEKWLSLIWAFVSFTLCASATYIVNDLLDVAADRSHPTKRSRPFASGRLPMSWGPPLVAVLGGVGLAIAGLAIGPEFLALLAGYAIITLLYSMWLKRKVMLDVVILASLYTLRIVAGGVAADVPISEWLLAFSLFWFTSLAFGKRYCELLEMRSTPVASRGRGYQVDDLPLVEVLGPCSGYLGVLVFALYIHGDTVKPLYTYPQLLWLICPALMYWISRYWIMARRGLLAEDPIIFALRDRVSRMVGAFVVAVALVATWHR